MAFEKNELKNAFKKALLILTAPIVMGACTAVGSIGVHFAATDVIEAQEASDKMACEDQRANAMAELKLKKVNLTESQRAVGARKSAADYNRCMAQATLKAKVDWRDSWDKNWQPYGLMQN